MDPEKVRYKVIGVEMKGMESSMKPGYEASGAGRITAQRLGRHGRGMDPSPKYVGRRTDPCLKGNG